ncbi:MAG: helix-turn-helix domain-containing protein [Lactobacillus sp.]|nr:helix-turn-helix domain-containing protein [Lactobacillus sp.]
MEKTFGQTLREIRQFKQVSINSLADESISKSQISRFERGESEISCFKLICLLDKLNLSIDEFMTIHNQGENHAKTFSALTEYIKNEYAAQRLDNLLKLLSDNSTYKTNAYEKTMIKSIIYTLDHRIKPSSEELQNLTDYLFKVEKWGYYEITLLGNCVRTINYSTLFLLTKEMLKNYIYSSLNKKNKDLVLKLAINCLIQSTDEAEFANCEYLISEIKKLLVNEFYFYEKTVFIYATGYCKFKLGQSDGIKQIKKALEIFELLDEKDFKAHYQTHFDQVTKKDLR